MWKHAATRDCKKVTSGPFIDLFLSLTKRALIFDKCCEHAVPRSKVNITGSCFCSRPKLIDFPPLLKNTFERAPSYLTLLRALTHTGESPGPSGTSWDPEQLWQEERSKVILSGHVLQVPLP